MMMTTIEFKTDDVKSFSWRLMMILTQNFVNRGRDEVHRTDDGMHVTTTPNSLVFYLDIVPKTL